MGKKNWIEFDNQEKKSEKTAKVDNFNKRSKINIPKQKKGKKGKTITLIKGLGTQDEILLKELLKKIKVFCGTGGILIDKNIQLQGDMVSKSIEFLRKEGFHNWWSRVRIGFNFDELKNERTKTNKVNQYKVAQLNYR